jgi:low affinity Fe/Cu permease
MINFKLNKDKIIPNLAEYIKVLISVVFVIYIFRPILYIMIPPLAQLQGFWALVFNVTITLYFKNLIDINFNGRDYF